MATSYDPLVRCWTDALSLLTSQQVEVWRANTSKNGYTVTSGSQSIFVTGFNAVQAWQNDLYACRGTMTRNQVLTSLGLHEQQVAARLNIPAPIHSVFEPKSLAETNLAYANELLSEAPLEWVLDMAAGLQVRTDVSEMQMRAGVALVTAGIATKSDQLIPEAIERERAKSGASGDKSFWEKFKSGWNKLWQNPGEWALRVFITEPGKAVEWAGKQLTSLSKNMWTQWLIDPLGILNSLGVFFEEIGVSMQDHSFANFDIERVTIAFAKSWQKIGMALSIAATYLPPPWDLASLALGAMLMKGGKIVLSYWQEQEMIAGAEAEIKYLEDYASEQERKARELEGATLITVSDGSKKGLKSLDVGAAIFLGSAVFVAWRYYG